MARRWYLWLWLAAATLTAGLADLPVTYARATFSSSAPITGNVFQTRTSFGLTQLPGTAGCTSEDGTGGACVDGKALQAVARVAVSPDDAHVYALAYIGDAVAVFSRNGSTGALTQLAGTAGCVSETGTSGQCVDGKALDYPWDVAVSPDGAHAYVASYVSDAVAVFSRNGSTGALTQLAGTAGCVSETGTSGQCVDGKALNGANGVAVSPGGAFVYVASYDSDAVAVFSRNGSTGALTQLAGTAGCVSETGTSGQCVDGKALDAPVAVQISPDGAHVYVASEVSDAVAVFSRDGSTGALTQLAGTAGCVSETGTGGQCVDGKALDGPYDVVVSPDGAHVYAASWIGDAVAVFSRDGSTGALTQLAGTAGCVSETGTGGQCVDGSALDGAQGVAVSPDGEDVYVASYLSDAVAVFRRDATSGELTQWSGTRGCVSETGTGGVCVDGKALDALHRVAVSPDGKDVYTGGGASPTGFVAAFSRSR